MAKVNQRDEMDLIQNDKNKKVANQAWRKKPRQFAPKSRLGCKTCKIRRVKCDLSRPSCLKCQGTGRACDGYSDLSLSSRTKVESSHYCNDNVNGAKSHDSYHSCTTSSAYQLKQWERYAEDCQGPILQNLGSFMILPMVGSGLTAAMSFFEYVSITHLNKYQPLDDSWCKTLVFFSQTVPSVRNAAIALALLLRNHIDGNSNSSDRVREDQLQTSKDWGPLDKEAPLFHYTMAIHHLLKQDLIGHDSAERTAITLLVCYLFTCFDHLAGNFNKAIRNNNNNDDNLGDDANSSEVQNLICQVTSKIHRLDMQAAVFLLDWTPTNIQETVMYQLSPSDSTFYSLGQAADYIQMLVARLMGLRNTEQQMYLMGEIPPPLLPSSQKDILLCQLETWSILFENMLQLQRGSTSSYETDSESNTLITLLRLQHTIAWILLNSFGSGREMEYDTFLPQFQQCMALASDVAAAHERYSGSLKPTFTPEIGILPVLYIIGTKCRHALVRREVLNILRRQSIREVVWTSICTAEILERVIEIEEGGSEGREKCHEVWVKLLCGKGSRLYLGYMLSADIPRLDWT
ncbi:hypothetical protein BGZ63DRAFT_397396 [Mariannaea sp. PMI_226]|nr:hypothetical protein BGZ63DRAFT_397396 [Mariannaea sp. PMI_226]